MYTYIYLMDEREDTSSYNYGVPLLMYKGDICRPSDVFI